MDYLDWIRALDRAHQYAELNGAVLTSLHQSGAVLSPYGYLSHDDISKAIIAASSRRGKPVFGYFVYERDKGWVKTDTMPRELDRFFRKFEKPRIKCYCDKEKS